MLTTNDIQKNRLKKAKINHTTYKMLYNMLKNKIISLQDVYPPVLKTSWQMPFMITGRPLFQHDRALNYIRDKLSYGGFDVRIEDETRMVHVSWESAVQKKKPLPNPDQLRKARSKLVEKEAIIKKKKAKSEPKQEDVLEMMASRAEELANKLRY
jgi:hypothetical protein